MILSLSPLSEQRLLGVHPDLIRITRRAIAITQLDFGVACGLRTLAEQEFLVRIGRSKTLHSRHLSGHAVDLCPVVKGKWDWDNVALFDELGPIVKKAGAMENIPVEWGKEVNGDWDRPHFQLPWASYPLTP